MFVRPPVARSSRNPGRRPVPNRIPMNEVNRPLLRQFIRNRRSDPRFEAYILEVREGPAVNGNTNAAASKSIPQPWVSVRDFEKGNHQIGLPVSICDTLLKHLLTCVDSGDALHADSSEESEAACGSSAAATDPQGGSPARASGDGKSPVDEVTSAENSPNKKDSSRSRPRFQLNRLQPIRIVCEATGCTLEVTARDPTAKRTSSSPEETEQPVPVDPLRRWIVSAPLETRTSTDQSTENPAPQSGRRRHPWEARGFLELHESLMPQLSAFIADVVTRYRSVDELPEVRSLYSASGGRRFFFDLRDTRWGKRLHISQVTDLHRNVIGIPLEALVSFRTRLDMIIHSLKLEDQHVLRSEIYGVAPERSSPRGQRRTVTTSRDRDTRENNEQTSDNRKDTGNNRGQYYGSRQRGRERRRQRMRSFTTGSATQQVQSRNEESTPEQSGGEPISNRSGQNGPVNQQQWNANMSRNRRFARRPRNTRPFNRPRRPPPPRNEDRNNNGESRGAPASTNATVPSAPEPAIDPGHVAQVAEASA